MTNPCGVNFDITRLVSKPLFWSRMRVLDPGLFVPRIENFNDAPLIEDLAAQFPNARVHARVMESKEEGGYHLRPKGLNDDRPMVAEPEAVIDKYGRLGKRNMSLYLLNEPNDKPPDDENPDAVERLNKYVVRASKHATDTETNITILNWGVQMPYPDGRFDEALEAMSEHRRHVTLGVHEYLPKYDKEGNLRIPYFVNILKRYKDVLKKPAPLISNTEFGYDGADGSGLSHFLSRGISPAQAALDFTNVIDNDYREYIDSGEFEGAAFFSYTQWNGFGLEGLPDFWKVLLDWHYIRTPQPTPAPQPPPVVVPPSPQPRWVATVARLKEGVKFVNLRQEPNVISNDLGDVKTGEYIEYNIDAIPQSGGWWHVRYKGNVGYIADKYFEPNVVQSPNPPAENPTPLPVPAHQHLSAVAAIDASDALHAKDQAQLEQDIAYLEKELGDKQARLKVIKSIRQQLQNAKTDLTLAA